MAGSVLDFSCIFLRVFNILHGELAYLTVLPFGKQLESSSADKTNLNGFLGGYVGVGRFFSRNIRAAGLT